MRISLGTYLSVDRINEKNGYGYATLCMLKSLAELGYEVNENDPTADVEIWFNQPQNWQWTPGVPYRIGYHPWESTKLLKGWTDIMNGCDEIWTPSSLTADWYVTHAGVRVPVYVYEHGVEHEWAAVNRKRSDHFQFLHVGAEASRKGAWEELVPAFRAAFGGGNYRDNVGLTLKMINSSWNGIEHLGGVHYINERWSIERLRQSFYDHHAYVYPSWGEGFGLTPLQAIATGMPTITVPRWAPYAEFLDPRLNLSSELTNTKWPDIHPGQMLKPNYDDLIDHMRWVVDNYEMARDFATSTAPAVHLKYDWNTLTKTTFEALEKRLNTSQDSSKNSGFENLSVVR